MLKRVINAVIGTRHDRERRRMQPIVDTINAEGERLATISDETLRAQTAKLRGIVRDRTAELEKRVAELREAKRTSPDPAARDRIDVDLHGGDGRSGAEGALLAEIREVLDEILPEAFATVREGARRLLGTSVAVTAHDLTWDMVHYDVQMMGGIQLHFGRIAEMATGEGKTLVATLPLYLNALAGRGAHLVTVNPYLSIRDSQWMGHLYTYLGMTVGCLDQTEPGSPQRRAAYLCDITYGTNNEFGFDYLRDNMVVSLDYRVQRPHWYAIVDEVDSVLIDEARTPLIISGPVGGENDAAYFEHNASVAKLSRRQTELVNTIVGEADRAMESGDSRAAAIGYYKAQLASPKNKRLMKVLQEPSVKQLVQKMELEHLADKRLPSSKQAFADIENDMLFVLDERGHSVHLTDLGVEFLNPSDPDAFILPDLSQEVHRIDHDTSLTAEERLAARRQVEINFAATAERLNIIHQLLRAHALYDRDVNYVVQNGEVLIVDEFTGRTMPGRRWSEGLHQAVEAKEGVRVQGETQTLATITIQNYFRLYEKLAGMTGTAETEETEFFEIYGLEVAVIPTNRPIIRDDRHDLIYKTRREKYNAIVDETRRLNGLGFPVLVGTTSVDSSETLSKLFQRAGLKHEVLNAKYHQREAEIISLAGQQGAITIATNMAGRGTDIKLGGAVRESKPSVIKDIDQNDVDVMELGGLHIIGSERHESRRIDRQLRGRAGRQGDPGASQFFLSVEDDLMRLFGGERLAKTMEWAGAKEGDVLTHPIITRSIEQAQKRVELQNFQTRKRLLDYDDVMNQQREVIYSLRSFALEGGEELTGEGRKMIERAIRARVERLLNEWETPADWDIPLIQQELLMHFLLSIPELADADRRPTNDADLVAAALRTAESAFSGKLAALNDMKDENGVGYGGRLLSLVMLNVLDEKWKDHLYDLDQLRNTIYYRSMGQMDPLIEYKKEAYTMFVGLMDDVYMSFSEGFLKAQLVTQAPPPPPSPVMVVPPPAAPRRRYNALGILEDIVDDGDGSAPPTGAPQGAMDVGPDEPLQNDVRVRPDPVVVGAGRVKSLNQPPAPPARTTTNAGSSNASGGWENVGRNDPCPCGSGKKFKKCHGATA